MNKTEVTATNLSMSSTNVAMREIWPGDSKVLFTSHVH